jgi:hypothetical protein
LIAGGLGELRRWPSDDLEDEEGVNVRWVARCGPSSVADEPETPLHVPRGKVEGLSNREIGACQRLYISVHTVEWHLHKVFSKLGVTSAKASKAHSRSSTTTLCSPESPPPGERFRAHHCDRGFSKQAREQTRDHTGATVRGDEQAWWHTKPSAVGPG